MTTNLIRIVFFVTNISWVSFYFHQSPKTFEKSFSTHATDSRTFQVSDDDEEEEDDDDDEEGENNRPVSVHDMRLQVAQRMKHPQTPELKAVDW